MIRDFSEYWMARRRLKDRMNERPIVLSGWCSCSLPQCASQDLLEERVFEFNGGEGEDGTSVDKEETYGV